MGGSYPGPVHFRASLNIMYYISAVLYSHDNVLTSTDIENGTVSVDGSSRPAKRVCKFFSFAPLANFIFPPANIVVSLWCLAKLTVWPAHFSDASAAYKLEPCQLSRRQFRRRTHDRQLHEHQGHLCDCNCIVQTISFIYTYIVISSAVCQMS